MKRIIAVVLVAAALLVSMGMLFSVTAASSYLRGDADCDNSVTVLDVTAIQRKLSTVTVNSFDERAADIDGDGVNIIDATLIQRFLASMGNDYHINELVVIPDPTTEPTAPTPTRDPYELPFIPKK